jgi:homoserine kinase
MPTLLPLAVRVPGSSANLGPGFDVFGLALRIRLEARIFPPGGGRPLVRCWGPHAEGIELDRSNLVLEAFRRTFEAAGQAAPEVCLELRNPIPLARGLGSSGAAVVAGVQLADRCGGLALPVRRKLAMAAELEQGHADNVSASLLGGFTVACAAESQPPEVDALRLSWPREIGVVVAIPEFRLETQRARAVLPDGYQRQDTVFNLQRAALLAATLASGRPDPERLALALADRLHQPYRAPLVPGLEEALKLRAPGLLGVALSGAGPALIAFILGEVSPAVAALSAVYARLGIPCEVRQVVVSDRGAEFVGVRC